MIHFRPYQNCDPPAITEIWRTHPPLRGLVQAMSTATLEHSILSKQYFDRNGFILAFDDKEPLGFVHAGFGANDKLTALSTNRGVISMLMVVPRDDRAEIASKLIELAERYLADRGAKEIYAGETKHLNPFYLGVYGGSAATGILATDQFQLDAFQQAGYVEQRRFHLLHRNLAGFRPIVDRTQMQIRRAYHVETLHDPPMENWWQACTLGQALRMRFDIQRRGSSESVGHATFWDMEPLASNWGIHAMGLVDLTIVESSRRQGLATWLLGESFRQLQSSGISMVEFQFDATDEPAIGMAHKFDVEKIDEAVSLKKQWVK